MQLNQNEPLVRSFLAYAHLLARYHQYRALQGRCCGRDGG
jgi:hypothetical protein